MSPKPDRTDDAIQSRKADHLRICLDDSVQCQWVTTGLEQYRFTHVCLPELALLEVQTSTSFLGKSLGAPLLISSMTGGTELAKTINIRLAKVAQQFNIAMGVGSQRVAVEHPQVADTFAVRSHAPDILLLANLGAVQLNYGYTIDHCQQVIDLLEADALILHLNPLQECIQSRGDRDFRGLLARIKTLCHNLPVPVIVKEVGNGISGAMAIPLIEAGVAAIDVAGAGGTSWAKVEGERAEDLRQRRLGQTFAEWGLPTAECVTSIRGMAPHIPLIASGGLRTGLDAAKAIALGANLVGMAYPFLRAAHESESALITLTELLIAELETVLFCTGNRDLQDLQKSDCLQPQ
ncbi:MAG: type 2 isopentenyl-diphosphate Delta-isomerase [Acaryochloridaceae cyanobacterium SU_2_1]|nr:type 2 isopentenyl-diphosphate Delta-isomerase [Acaryochloridaceae cyanobacterium SU_2_1]